MVTYIKSFGVIRQGSNSFASLKPFYFKVLFSVSKTWTNKYGSHYKTFFAAVPNGVKYDDVELESSYKLDDSLAVSILANCRLVKTFEL